MKGKIWVSALLIYISMLSAAYAAVPSDEESYQDMREVRRKLVRMRREMDGFMRDLMQTPPADVSSPGLDDEVRIDLLETDKDIIVKADLPGMNKDKIDITLINNRTLKIVGTRDVMRKEDAPGVVRQERMVGRFERTLELPADGMSEGIKAVYENGVLEIMIPKKKKAGPEAVKIAVQ